MEARRRSNDTDRTRDPFSKTRGTSSELTLTSRAESEDTDVDVQPWKNFSRAESDTSLPPVPEDLNGHEHEADSEFVPEEGSLDQYGSPGIHRSERRFSDAVNSAPHEFVLPEDHDDFPTRWDSHMDQLDSHMPPPPDHDEHDLLHGVAVNSLWAEDVVPPDKAPTRQFSQPLPPTQTWEPKYYWNDQAVSPDVPPAPHHWQDAPDMPAFGEGPISPRSGNEVESNASPSGSKDLAKNRRAMSRYGVEAHRLSDRGPPRREWTPEKRFSIHDIAVTEAGVTRNRSSKASSYTADTRMQATRSRSRCCCCRFRFCRCRCCYCCPRDLCGYRSKLSGARQTLWTSFCAMVFGLVAISLLSWLLWDSIDPSIAEGGFGLLIQTDRQEAVSIQYFHKARPAATAYLKSSQAGVASTQLSAYSTSSINAGNPTGLGDGRWWAHVELIFHIQDGNLVTAERLHEVKQVEQAVRQLPGWQKLCSKVPEAQRYYCSPGDTLANVAFGEETAGSTDAVQKGVISEVQFNGLGHTFIMPVQSLLTYLRDFRTAAYRRWLVDEKDSEVKDSPIRSLFSFYLRDGDIAEWESFALNDLEPAIEEEISKAADREESNGKVLHIFYRVSRLESQEFDHAVRGDIVYSYFVTIAALVATLLTTRRLLLGIASMVLALTAQTAASAIVATQDLHGRSDAYPAIAVGSWFLVTVNCADLAVASTCAWTANLRYRPQTQDLKLWLRFTWRLGRFLVEVPVPMLAQACALLISGSIVNMPIYTEFAHHAGISMAIALTFAVIAFPPAIELGDQLNQKSKQSDCMLVCGRRMHGLVPYELGGGYWCCQMGRALTKKFLNAFRSPIVRGATLISLLTVILGVLFSVPPIGPALKYDWNTPNLFSEDHRLRLAPEIRARFGLALPGPSEPPVVAEPSARMCHPDAHDSASCSWMTCDRDVLNDAQSNSCRCSYQSSAGTTQAYSVCGAVARFSGSGSNDFARTYFWSWLEGQLQMNIVSHLNTTVPAAPMSAFLEIEDWTAGTATTWSQLEMKVREADTSVLLWEEACFKAFCNCGPWQCRIEGEEWNKLSDYIPSSGDRRMDADNYSDRAPGTTPVGVADHARFLSRLPRMPESGRKRRTTASSTVFGVWGLQKSSTIPSRNLQTKLSFDASFDITSPWAQRNIFRSCDGPAPDLGVISTSCWAMDFKRWLAGRGVVFPLQANAFYSQFEQFTADMEVSLKSTMTAGFVEDTTYNYFWIDAKGQVKGCYAVFYVEAPSEETISYADKWSAYMQSRVGLATGGLGDVWVTSDAFATSGSPTEMKAAAKAVILSAICCTGILVLLLTCSCGLAIVSVGILSFAFGVVVCLVLGVEQQTLGVMEIVALAAFMTSLITPVVRVLQQYSLAHEMPRARGKHAEKRRKTETQAKPPRRADQLGINTWSYGLDDSEHPSEFRSDGGRKVEFLSMDSSGVDTYLVDNRIFQAKTQGLGYRLSPMLQDLDRSPNVQKCMAQWGSLVTGVPHGPDWLRVDDRFLPMALHGVTVLTLIEPEADEMPELLFDEDEDDDEDGDHRADDTDEDETDDEEMDAQPTELTVYSHLLDDSEPLSEVSDDDALCNCDWEKMRRYLCDACIRLWFFFSARMVGKHGNMLLKRGMQAEERYARMVKTLRMSSQTVLGSSIAGFLVGLAFAPLTMASLGRIGLAIFCAAISVPHAALVVVPTIVLFGFGPTRTAKVALVRFCDWWIAGRPKKGMPIRHTGRTTLHGRVSAAGGRPSQFGGAFGIKSSGVRPQAQAVTKASMIKSMSGSWQTSASKRKFRAMTASAMKRDPGEMGETAARVLGFPFNLGVSSKGKNAKNTKAALRQKAASQQKDKAGGDPPMVNIWSTSYVGATPKNGRVIL